jgi:hypothetical protein
VDRGHLSGPDPRRRLLTSDEVAAVLRRASELDQRGDQHPAGIELAALEEAAGEVGLSPAAVHQALAELDVGALRRTDGVVAEQSVIERPIDRVERDLERLLHRQLLVVRRDGHRSLWQRRTDVYANVVRYTDPRGWQRLRAIRELRVHLAAVDDGESTLVRLEVDGMREPSLSARVGLPAGAGALAGGGAALVAHQPELLVVGLPVAAAAAMALKADARVQRRRAERRGYGLSALLAELARR